MTERFAFGANWRRFVETYFTEERRDNARRKLLDGLGIDTLGGKTFLDIGSGSGLHSLAAFDSQAMRLHSFDYDHDSVVTTELLRRAANNPANWTAERGDVLDDAYMDRLGLWDVVYSWGVLHHTGDMWRAVENASKRVAPDGIFFIALYSSDVASPSPEFWIDIKRRYNATGRFGRVGFQLWYLWRFGLDYRPWRLPVLLKQMRERKHVRGMSYMTDLHDWLGGWPMQYAADKDVVKFVSEREFKLDKMITGEACSEFIFRRTG